MNKNIFEQYRDSRSGSVNHCIQSLEELEFIQKKQTESITSLARDINDLSDDSLSTKDSEDSSELKTKKLSISQKNLTKKLHKERWILMMKNYC